jgi:hypothetical protein
MEIFAGELDNCFSVLLDDIFQTVFVGVRSMIPCQSYFVGKFLKRCGNNSCFGEIIDLIMTVLAIAAGLGVSAPCATEIRRGRRIPHPRHWQSLAQLVGILAEP